ncbi:MULTISPECIES: DUF2937 family protein [unclassified Shewanella]|uniref:DUF2937 family protein n=1 Tax=Shewanella TaxID=22 RepID=UPI0021DB4339|nr:MULTISPECIES: DUF2937 family protein [unclassified Shewanella]MCU8020378.1 DUF2937 family protein [Shewanella sp. SM78]MCU8045782.1 DUF2937 family protein [Shewanella sp. SM68]MCU8050018.1 DUF2937 family protein [Shewanella sp. SM65]MCU8077554.1 DUF2937 family protein [Shewanella sp. SM103]
MIARLIDKLVFGFILVIALQLPQLADHYQQFLSGLYESTRWQVEGYEATAKEYHYADVDAMIASHQQNEEPSVRADAEQKVQTLALYKALTQGVAIFNTGNLFEKTAYMFNPVRFDYLEKTISNFKPGIPLTSSGIGFGVLVALVVHYLGSIPFILWSRRNKRLKTSP